MGVVRRWVFPILRILVFALIAAALIKLAFFPDVAEAQGPAFPTGQLSDPQVTVELGTIVNDVTLDGTVSADPAVVLKATAVGAVDEIFIAEGKHVDKGDKIFDIKVETPQDPIETTDDKGVVTITQPDPIITYEKVFAPITGTLTALTVIPKQAVAVGDESGKVAPPSFSVSGTLSPEQQYRLLDEPEDATVAITGGPAPFACEKLRITAPLAGEQPDPTTGDGATGATVRCLVPEDVRVFPGLTASITIPAGQAENVLVVPTTAVEGGAETGVVHAVLPEGGTEPRDVTLGLTDGSMVEVTGGLEQGEAILQFSPDAQAPVPGGEECFDDGSGNVVCGGGGIVK
ncbi:MAG: hypothetical protein JWR33_2031 [Naasia sp.]|jgi:macrolide-specific efflux system membrane fusion protein|uniref:efflux RND transporter periplasmic adaptor subunit n=1 Tax=Naasia sp. TaxID=2546198 RepID=UPI002635217D|nr:hypothetical protein [Naasia sp.]MCU1571290.1 hypothetical protein [Naasia sp.]